MGTQTSLNLEWKLSKRLDLGAAYVHFDPREVTREAGGSSGRVCREMGEDDDVGRLPSMIACGLSASFGAKEPTYPL